MSTAYHFIAIMSHYQKGTRIGWHYSSFEKLDKEKINIFFENVKKKCGDVQFGIHKLSTESTSWASVMKKDQFFADVFVTDDMDAFIKSVSNDKTLSANDVAKFILTIIPSSHLKLQKLLYYCYAEFLQKTGLKLFSEPIVAYKYGPVVEEVFKNFKIHGSSIIDYHEDDKFIITTKERTTTPSFIKIAASEHGLDAIDTIANVLKTYGHCTPYELVTMTHKPGGPWERLYKEGQNCILSDQFIEKYHEFVK